MEDWAVDDVVVVVGGGGGGGGLGSCRGPAILRCGMLCGLSI